MAITSIKTGSSFTNLKKYNDFLGPNAPFIPTDFESIATLTAAGGETSLTFSSIPGTYKHLQIRGIGRLSGTSEGYGYSYIHFNGGPQATHALRVQGTSVGAEGATSAYYQIPSAMTPSNAPTGAYGALIIDIIDYASTTKPKTIRGFSGYNTNGAALTYYHGVGISSALATGLGTSALTSVQITSGPFGETFVAGSKYALYGIKG